MSERRLTEKQQAVIDHEGGALLVSAAAGSGKTMVLVERLLRKICQPGSSCNVDDFLIITFTQAAAAELKSKIASAIGERLANDGGNRHLRRQLSHIYLAQISTVHAFCTEILREYANVLDIPADFRVADETECLLLKEQVLEKLQENLYETLDKNPQRAAFLETLGFGRDDRNVSELVLEVYKNLQSHAWPKKWLQSCRNCLSEQSDSIENTPWGAYLLDDFRDFLEEQMSQLDRAGAKLIGTGVLEKCIPVIEDDKSLLRRIMNDLSWDRLYTLGEPSFTRFPSLRNVEYPELKNEVKNIRDTCKSQLKKKLRPFSDTAENALKEQLLTHEAILGLLDIVQEFTDAYAQKKRQRRIVDFSDLEHEAIRLLIDPYTGAPTAAAREISRRFTEIMVDEYQDTNEVQDSIFRAVSRDGDNLFMVGDVKQSIYRFRLADPGIFLDKYHSFISRENDGSRVGRKIFLSHNFRSAPAVIEAVNHVFSMVMSPRVGDVAYTSEEQLNLNPSWDGDAVPGVELCCISTKAEAGDDAPEKTEAEAVFVANKIRMLLNGEHYVRDKDGMRRIRPDDIAILMRTVSSTAHVYAQALAEQGIPVAAEKTESIFSSTEICTLLAILDIVDNPHRDISLVTAMCSPVGEFSADEMAQIRSFDRSADLYDAVCLSAESQERPRRFLEQLSGLRSKLGWMELPEFIDAVLEETGFRNVFSSMEDGQRREENIRRFRELVVSAVGTGVQSLSAFLRYVAAMRENGISPIAGEKSGSGVTIMSIHKSKGLEFPVVFLSDLSRAFSAEDDKKAVRMDPELYIGCNVVNRELMAKYPSTAKFAISEIKRREMLSEELRLLYVAMTRAKDKLIMTYCSKSAEKHIQDAANSAALPVQPCVAADVSSMGQWVLLAAAVRPEGAHLFGGAVTMPEKPKLPWDIRFYTADSDGFALEQESKQETAPVPVQPPLCLTACVEHRHTPRFPAKLTATQLKGRELDNEAAEAAPPMYPRQTAAIRHRQFGDTHRPLTGAQKGTATHLFLQYCDFKVCANDGGTEQELRRMVEQEFLSPLQADAVAVADIKQFFKSPLGQRIMQAADYRREFKFSLMMPAQELIPDAPETEIMLQGVVDCILFEDDGMVVIDFKTDALSPGEEESRSAYYAPQLNTYKKALEKIYCRPVKDEILYYFATGSAVSLKKPGK